VVAIKKLLNFEGKILKKNGFGRQNYLVSRSTSGEVNATCSRGGNCSCWKKLAAPAPESAAASSTSHRRTGVEFDINRNLSPSCR
jgi:hypothetical protein